MSDYLIHYGVKGMKWGVRRARNKYALKAKAQSMYFRKNSRSKSDFDDPELWDLMTPEERRREKAAMKKRVASSNDRYSKAANAYAEGARRIEKAKTRKEAKQIYKSTKEQATAWVWLGRDEAKRLSMEYDNLTLKDIENWKTRK